MARRRGNNEGTVYQDKDGVWWAKLPADEHGNRPKRRAKTQREAIAKLREMERERAQGVNVSAKQPTVADFAATWLAQVERDAKPSTHQSYTNVVRYYITPNIGTIRLDKLTPQRVQAFINDLRDEEFAAHTIWNVYRRLRTMLRVAVQYRLIAYNPAAAISMPKMERNVERALTIAECRAFLRAVEGHRLAALYHVLLTLGLRRGEALGLAWRDLDWEAAEIKVTQQVQDFSGKTVIGTPKTDTSRRTLPLPDGLLARLRLHAQNQREEQQLRGPKWNDHGLIFASEVGTPLGPRNVLRQFGELLKAAGLVAPLPPDAPPDATPPPYCRLHDLRHSCATLLGELGVEERVIGAILGHTPATVTGRYAQVTMEMKRDGVKLLEALLAEPSE